MSSATTPSVVRQIGSLFDGGSVVGFTDRQLVDRFNQRRDDAGEAAFAALVTRHGPMVMHLCRQLLDDHHAEDAFQATFLVLARKARSIRDSDKLANWLYGVALRTAKKARGRIARRHKNEVASAMRHPGSDPGVSVEPRVQPAEQSVLAREQAEILHREIDRLPGPFRLPIVLCYFEGLTLEEAAHRLRCPAGTVRSRLARACDKLRRGLTRRGVVLSGAGLVAALSSRSASASVSSLLCDHTTRAAIQFAAGQALAGTLSASAAALAREVLRSMLIHKLRFILVILLAIAAGATGAGLWTTHSLAIEDEPKKTTAAPQSRPAAKPEGAKPGRMIVVGRVLDPQGKPVPNAIVMVHTRLKRPENGLEGLSDIVIGHADADGSGQFRLDSPRTSSSRNDEFMAVALAPGYGVGWTELDPDANQPDAEIRLRPEQVIQGRLFDLQGRPAQGVVVSVSRILRILLRDSGNVDRGRGRVEGPHYWWARVNDLPAWPKPATTDADGRFTVHGVGRGLQATLSITDSRFAMQMFDVETENSPDAKPVTLALRPAQIITGRVTYADTGKPVPHARLIVNARGGGQPRTLATQFQTDADGRFRANSAPGDEFNVNTGPPAEQPYLGASKSFSWPKGAIEYSLDLSLPRGVLIRGKVIEEGSQHPVAGALVVFGAHFRNDRPGGEGGQTKTLADGSFELTGPPRPGHMVVQGPGADYMLQKIRSREFYEGQPGGTQMLYSHAFLACDPKPGGTSPEVNVTLRRGATVTGRILAPDDQPVPDTWIISRIALGPRAGPLSSWQGNYHGNARNGRFELHGLDPDSDVPVHFLEPKRKLGATVQLSGKSAADGQMTVRLQPCGTAQARLVDPNGRPVAGYRDQYLILMIVAPGADRRSPDPADANRPLAELDYLTRIDSINYLKEPTSDAQGRIVFPALIPGATYRISVRPPRAGQAAKPLVRKDFTVKPGETRDLGDILIEKPNRD